MSNQNKVKFPYCQKQINELDIVFFAKNLVSHYSNVSEPNEFPDAYEMYIPRSQYLELQEKYDSAIRETQDDGFQIAELKKRLQSKDQRIKELEKSLQASRDNADICTKVLIDGSKEKDAEIQRLREALEYYAPSEKWSSCISDGNIFNEQTGDFVECFDSENMDCGSTAREALSGGKE